MAYRRRFKILTGPHAGQIFDGQSCNGRKSPTDPPSGCGDGVWIPALNLWMPIYVGNVENPDFEDLDVPFDANNEEIFVGTEILFSTSNGKLVVGRVKKIGKATHRGYGLVTRSLTVEPFTNGGTKERAKQVLYPYLTHILRRGPGTDFTFSYNP